MSDLASNGIMVEASGNGVISGRELRPLLINAISRLEKQNCDIMGSVNYLEVSPQEWEAKTEPAQEINLMLTRLKGWLRHVDTPSPLAVDPPDKDTASIPPKPYAIYEKLLEVQPGINKGQSLRDTKKLLADGYTPQEIMACAKWIHGDSWRRERAIPLNTAEIVKRIADWKRNRERQEREPKQVWQPLGTDRLDPNFKEKGVGKMWQPLGYGAT